MKAHTLVGLSGVGVIGAAAGLALSLFGAPAEAQTAGASAANPGVKSLSITTNLQPGAAGIGGGQTSTWSFKSGQDAIRIQSKDGKVVRAEQNGKEIPVDRVTMKDGQITVLDENGKVAMEFGAPVTTFQSWSALPGSTGATAWRSGPMINAYGQQISGPGSSGSWLGFGPSTTAAENIEPPKVMMGITMAEPEYGLRKHCGLDQRPGTMVNEVYKNMPAAKAGIQPFDVIVEIDGKSPATPDVIRSVLRTKSDGDQVRLRVLHKCEPKDAVVTLEAFDAEKLEQARTEQMQAAGVEPPSLDEQPLDAQEALRSLIARIQPGAGGAPGGGMVFVNPGMDDEALNLRISEAIKRLHDAEAPRALTDDRAKQVEARLDRLERLLERLVEQRDPPVPPATKPAPTSTPKGGA